jgi:hypothetical protein
MRPRKDGSSQEELSALATKLHRNKDIFPSVAKCYILNPAVRVARAPSLFSLLSLVRSISPVYPCLPHASAAPP